MTQAPGHGGPGRHTCWLATINADGSPHVTGVGALWADGCFWFETGRGTRKGRNLARDPRCTISVATREFDLVVDGDAAAVARVPAHPAHRDGAVHRGARRGDPLAVLSSRLRAFRQDNLDPSGASGLS